MLQALQFLKKTVGCGSDTETGLKTPWRTVIFHVAALLLITSVNSSQAFLHVSNKNIVDSQGKNILWRGFGLGEWLNIENYFLDSWPGEDVGSAGNPTWGHTAIRNKLNQLMGAANADEFYRRWVANIITEADVAQYAGWGVNSIRVSINYHWLSSADGVYKEDGFRLLDNLIGWGKKYGVYIILCMHAAPGGQGNELMADVIDGNPRMWTEPATYQPWTINLWQKIAQRYAGEEWVGAYDIFDEPLPPDNSNTRSLLPLYKKITAAIRLVDKNHMLIFEGIEWAQDFTGLDVPWDDNMAYSWHKYWDTNNQASVQPYVDLRTKTNCPIWNGETGEKDDTWDKAMVALCEKNNIGWAMWTTKKVNQNTNPYTIKTPANYSRVIGAVTGGSITQAEATAIMLALADNAATSKCTKNSAFITALGLCATCPPAKPIATSANDLKNLRPAQSGIGLRTINDAGGIKVSFDLPRAASVKILLYDILGSFQEILLYTEMQAGTHFVEVESSSQGGALPRGIYYCVLFVENIRSSISPVVAVK